MSQSSSNQPTRNNNAESQPGNNNDRLNPPGTTDLDSLLRSLHAHQQRTLSFATDYASQSTNLAQQVASGTIDVNNEARRLAQEGDVEGAERFVQEHLESATVIQEQRPIPTILTNSIASPVMNNGQRESTSATGNLPIPAASTRTPTNAVAV